MCVGDANWYTWHFRMVLIVRRTFHLCNMHFKFYVLNLRIVLWQEFDMLTPDGKKTPTRGRGMSKPKVGVPKSHPYCHTSMTYMCVIGQILKWEHGLHMYNLVVILAARIHVFFSQSQVPKQKVIWSWAVCWTEQIATVLLHSFYCLDILVPAWWILMNCIFNIHLNYYIADTFYLHWGIWREISRKESRHDGYLTNDWDPVSIPNPANAKIGFRVAYTCFGGSRYWRG